MFRLLVLSFNSCLQFCYNLTPQVLHCLDSYISCQKPTVRSLVVSYSPANAKSTVQVISAQSITLSNTN